MTHQSTAVHIIFAHLDSDSAVVALHHRLMNTQKNGAKITFVDSMAAAIAVVDSFARINVVIENLQIQSCFNESTRPHWLGFGVRAELSPQQTLAAMLKEGRVGKIQFTPPLNQASANHASLADLIVVLDSSSLSENAWAVITQCADESTLWRLRDCMNARALGGERCGEIARYGPPFPKSGVAIFFHGTSSPLTTICKKRDRLWVSPSRAFAVCFAVNEIQSGQWMQGVDILLETPRVIVFVPDSESRQRLRGQPIYLHELRAQADQVEPAGNCARYEFRLDNALSHECIQSWPNAEAAFLELGVLVEIPDSHERTAHAINDCRLENILELHRPRCIEVIGATPQEILLYPSLRRSATSWIGDEAELPITEQPWFNATNLLRLLRRVLLPEAADRLAFANTQGHGANHAWLVSHLALLIAIENNQPPIAPTVAAIFHDCARISDDEDVTHAQLGSEKTRTALMGYAGAFFQDSAINNICAAIAEHSIVGTPCNTISSVLRDADRLSLAWERGVNPKYFHTKVGLAFAQGGTESAENAFRRRFGAPLFDTVGFIQPHHTIG